MPKSHQPLICSIKWSKLDFSLSRALTNCACPISQYLGHLSEIIQAHTTLSGKCTGALGQLYWPNSRLRHCRRSSLHSSQLSLFQNKLSPPSCPPGRRSKGMRECCHCLFHEIHQAKNCWMLGPSQMAFFLVKIGMNILVGSLFAGSPVLSRPTYLMRAVSGTFELLC